MQLEAKKCLYEHPADGRSTPKFLADKGPEPITANRTRLTVKQDADGRGVGKAVRESK